MTIRFRGLAVKSLAREYWSEAEHVDEFGEVTPYRGPKGGVGAPAPERGQMMLMDLPRAVSRPPGGKYRG